MSLNHTKQKSWPQRLLALLAAVVLCAALPAAALAEENTASIQTQVSETDEDIPWADPPQSTPETGRPDPAVPTPPQDPATPETAQTGEHLEGYSLSLGETVTIYFYVTLPEDTPQDAAMQFTPAGFHRNTGGSGRCKAGGSKRQKLHRFPLPGGRQTADG